MTEITDQPQKKKPSHGGLSRYYHLPKPIRVIFLVGPVVAIILFILHWFSVPVGGSVLSATRYYYLLYAALGFNVLIGIGGSGKRRNDSPPWYDYVLASILWIIVIYFLANSASINANLWDDPPGPLQYVAAVTIGVLAIEAGRRVGGWGFVALLVVSIIYPLVADKMPGRLWGASFTFDEVLGNFAFGDDGMLGLPAYMLGELILGFYLFAGVMMGMGGGEFFLKLATAIAGKWRGGPAKVAVISSGFFGSLSGSIVANIAGTGAFTIPAMKKMGYPPEYAAAIETCASTGGDTMPPVMGGMVFFMVYIANVEYADVLVAAFLPTLLHYWGLLMQVDSYAARTGLKGLPKKQIPPIGRTLREGWIYLLMIAFLVFGLVYMRWGAITPIYAVALVIILQFITWLFKKARDSNNPEMSLAASSRRAFNRTENALAQAAGLINYGTAVFLGMGFILVGLNKTGLAGGLTAWIISLAGQNFYLIMLIGVVFCLIMGMVGLQRASYLFLAITMAPALVEIGANAPELAAIGGVSVIAVHLFIIFYSGLGGFTPPVALHAFIAAGIAGADPMKTAWLSMRLGIVLIFIPFFFVLQPALLIIDQPWHSVLLHLSLAMIGIWLLASGLEQYLAGVGRLNWWSRPFLMAGGFLIAFPQWITTIIGFVLCAAGVIIALVIRKTGRLQES